MASVAHKLADEPQAATPLVEVSGLCRSFAAGRRGWFGRKLRLRAVDGVSFTLYRRETLGLVGESGCGKSTTGKLVLGLLPASEGEVRFAGTPVTAQEGPAWRRLRRTMQLVHQDAAAALDPRVPVGVQVREPLDIHGIGDGAARDGRVAETLRAVGLEPELGARYPHQLSGGQQQRVVIARALIVEPALVVCDEPVSALDVSVQAQVVNLLSDLQAARGLTYLFISHDLGVVRHVSHRIAVMYLGRIVELAPTVTLFADPRHPYTRALIAAVPVPDPRARREPPALKGDPPSPLAPPPGCAFHTRCPFASDVCRREVPPLRPYRGGHLTACHHAEALP